MHFPRLRPEPEDRHRVGLRGSRELMTLSYTYVPDGGTHVVSRPSYRTAAGGAPSPHPRHRPQAAHAGPTGDGPPLGCWLASSPNQQPAARQPAARTLLAQAVPGDGFRSLAGPAPSGTAVATDAATDGDLAERDREGRAHLDDGATGRVAWRAARPALEPQPPGR